MSPPKPRLKVGRFEAGLAAVRGGRRAEARTWLRLACADDPSNDAAWLWLASVTDDPNEAIRYLERALALNPANHKARAGIEQLRVHAATSWHCPICLTRADSPRNACPECRAVLDLAQGDAAIGNPYPDVMRIREGAARLGAKAKNKPDFETCYFLGMALLNLGKPEIAILHFRSCRTLRPEDKSFSAHVDLLELRARGGRPTHVPAAASFPERIGPAPQIDSGGGRQHNDAQVGWHDNAQERLPNHRGTRRK